MIYVQFGRYEILNCDASDFLERFRPDALPTGPQLAAMMGMFAFVVMDYDEDPREIYTIPEIRTFYQHLHRVWPHWFFFCNLEVGCLTSMTLCMLNKIEIVSPSGGPRNTIRFDPEERIGFINHNLELLAEIMDRAEMTDMDYYNRNRELAKCFDLPFDFPPPVETSSETV